MNGATSFATSGTLAGGQRCRFGTVSIETTATATRGENWEDSVS
jgi:hypothetical protein